VNEQPTIQKNAFKSRSQRGSTGGFAIAHIKTQGMGALIGAPKLFQDAAFRAPLAKKPKEPKQSIEWPDIRTAFKTQEEALAIAVFFAGRLKTPPIPSMCPLCGDWFVTKNQRGRHQFGCAPEGAD
jgi:hypothetical protein